MAHPSFTQVFALLVVCTWVGLFYSKGSKP
jgi:hypothetical protein